MLEPPDIPNPEQFRLATCTSCGRRWKLDGSFEGTRARCKESQCGGVVEIGPIETLPSTDTEARQTTRITATPDLPRAGTSDLVLFCRRCAHPTGHRSTRRSRLATCAKCGCKKQRGSDSGSKPFELLAGNFLTGKGHRFTSEHIFMRLPNGGHEEIETVEIVGLSIATEERSKKFFGSAGLALAGQALLGPAGLLAGALAGGRSSHTTFVCELADGRTFLGTTRTKDYRVLASAAF